MVGGIVKCVVRLFGCTMNKLHLSERLRLLNIVSRLPKETVSHFRSHALLPSAWYGYTVVTTRQAATHLCHSSMVKLINSLKLVNRDGLSSSCKVGEYTSWKLRCAPQHKVNPQWHEKWMACDRTHLRSESKATRPNTELK